MTRRMKDSGIEWIGEVPEDWEVIKFKYILEPTKNAIRVGPFGSQIKGDDFVESGYMVFNQRTVLDNDFLNGDAFINKDKYNDLAAFRVESNDILITTRGTIGKIAIVPIIVKEGIIHPCIIKATPNLIKINLDFLKYIFNETDITFEQFVLYSNATTIPVIYSEPLKNVCFPFPSILEQTNIVNYLDQKCAKIDETIEKQNQVIEKLKAYKQSVITEVVTKGLNPDIPMKDSGVEWIGEIPEHWEVARLGKLLSGIKDGTHSSYNRIEAGKYLLSAKNVYNDGLRISENESMISQDDYESIIKCGYPTFGDVMLTTIGGSIGRALAYTFDEICAFQRSVIFLRPNKDMLNYKF